MQVCQGSIVGMAFYPAVMQMVFDRPLSNLNPLSTTVTNKNIKLFISLSSMSMTVNLVGNFILHNSNRKSEIKFDIFSD